MASTMNGSTMAEFETDAVHTIVIHLNRSHMNGSNKDGFIANGSSINGSNMNHSNKRPNLSDLHADKPIGNGQTQDAVYVPRDKPPPTRLATKCHPLADQVCAELDAFFAKHWPWENQRAKGKFLAADVNRWACWALPLARNDRILNAVKVNTLLFLLDDVAENMSLEAGKALYKRLIPIAKGNVLPDRTDAYEWITYDVWASMRAVDEVLTEAALQDAILCVNAQVDPARNSCAGMGSLLKQRYKEGGVRFVAAAMRYAMDLKVTQQALDSAPVILESYSRLGIVVNDIYSLAKELHAWNIHHTEGGQVLNMVVMQAEETGTSYEAAKRVLWVLCREWELEHFELIAQREAALEGCSEDLRVYMKGLEYVLGGNEEWSSYTGRYHELD